MVVAVAVGAFHSAAVTKTGNVWTWGSNAFGQLGVGDQRPRSQPELITTLRGKGAVNVACGGDHTIVLTTQLTSADDAAAAEPILAESPFEAAAFDSPLLSQAVRGNSPVDGASFRLPQPAIAAAAATTAPVPSTTSATVSLPTSFSADPHESPSKPGFFSSLFSSSDEETQGSVNASAPAAVPSSSRGSVPALGQVPPGDASGSESAGPLRFISELFKRYPIVILRACLI
jgi:hypothetical protein